MTQTEARQYVADHSDDDVMDRADLIAVFTALAGREPNEDEIGVLWSHCCNLACE